MASLRDPRVLWGSGFDTAGPVESPIAECTARLTICHSTGKLPHSPGNASGERLKGGSATRPSAVLYSVLAPSMAMTEQRVSYTLDSSLETIDSAEEKATIIATELGFPDDEVMQISMAVREGAVNAVLHGNAYAPDKKVTLAFERAGGDLIITIRDQGKGLDLNKIPNPLAPENLLKTSGRGIFLMRSFMDVVEIRPSQTGTELKLIKHVHGPTAGGKEASQ
jgi:serine/threonine-protein kinase RsbW